MPYRTVCKNNEPCRLRQGLLCYSPSMTDNQQNTPENWDDTWSRNFSAEEDDWRFAQTEQELRWIRLNRRILKHFGGYEGLKAIEIGAGSGTYSALMARRGAQVTVLDYSDKALERSAQFFRRHQVDAEMVQANALHFPAELHGRFDLSMSFGLAEHFLNEERRAVLRSHFQLIRSGGMAVVSVPNAWNFPYRLYKYSAEKRGTWGVGLEYPFTRGELASYCKQENVASMDIFGDSFLTSVDYFFLKPIARKLCLIEAKPLESGRIPKEIPTPLDNYFSYSLVLCAVKR